MNLVDQLQADIEKYSRIQEDVDKKLKYLGTLEEVRKLKQEAQDALTKAQQDRIQTTIQLKEQKAEVELIKLEAKRELEKAQELKHKLEADTSVVSSLRNKLEHEIKTKDAELVKREATLSLAEADCLNNLRALEQRKVNIRELLATFNSSLAGI